MARIDLSIPSLGDKFIDLRDSLPGDSFNWSWVRALSQVQYLAIHHSAGADTQTPFDIATEHISKNGWGGIGYHFLISSDGRVYYVGDISTARANVANLNDAVIGICLIGNFVSGRYPSNEQLDSAHKLCDFFINNYPDLVNLASFEQVLGHKDLPNQATNCPGDSWESWRAVIVSGINPEEKKEEDLSIPPQQDSEVEFLKDQISNLQTSLSTINQSVLSLQEALEEKDKEIINLRSQVETEKNEESLTLANLFINLYKFIFVPRKAASA